VSEGTRYSVDGDDIVGEIILRIELEDDLVRDMYGRGGGFGLSTVGDLAAGMFGDRFVDISWMMFPSGRPDIISIPNSSMGRGGGLSTIASSNYKGMI